MKKEKFNSKNFFNTERKLDRIIRFSAQMRIKDESVAEHSFHTAFYAMILADLEEKIFGNKVNKEKTLEIALLHDIEECLTGDIIHSFKFINKSLSDKIEEMGQKFLESFMENLPEKFRKEYMDFWKESRDKKTIEGKIVDAADKLEGLIYSLNEFNLGNKDFKKIILSYKKLLKAYRLKSINMVIKELL